MGGCASNPEKAQSQLIDKQNKVDARSEEMAKVLLLGESISGESL